MFRVNYFKTAYRNIVRNKLFSLINILGLALGMAVCILLTASALYEYSTDRFHENKDSIYRVIQVGEWMNGEVTGNKTIPYMLTPTLKQKFPEIKDYVRLKYYGGAVFKVNNQEFSDLVLLAEPSFFNIFSFKLLYGNEHTALPETNSAVLSESTAKKYFPDENPLGKTLIYNNNIVLTVTGVIEDSPKNSSIRYDVILPFDLLGKERIESWSWESFAYVLMQDGTDIPSFLEKTKGLINEYQQGNPNEVSLQLLTREALYDSLDNPGRLSFILIELSIAFFILLLAIINFINLTTARSAKRTKEIAMRKVVGASKKQLVFQFLSESIFIVFIAVWIALILVELFLPQYKNLVQKDIVIDYLNFKIILSVFAFTIFVGIVAGLYPAIYLSGANINNILKKTPVINANSKLRALLVIFQFTISIALLISTLTVYKQFNFMLNSELGFEKENIVSVYWNDQLNGVFPAFREELLKNTNVIDITYATGSPAYIGNVNPPKWDEKNEEDWLLFNFTNVDKNFINFFGLEIINGQNFYREFKQVGDAQYILNEKAVRIMGYDPLSKDIIGKRFTMWDESIEGSIVGVVKDFHFQPLSNEITPLMITNLDWWKQYCFIKVSGNNFLDNIRYIENTYKKFVPDFPIHYTFLEDSIEQHYNIVKSIAHSVLYASWLAIFISLLGLTGLTLFMTELRTKEIGIRKVMGASVKSIICLLAKDFLKLILISNIFAWPVAFYFMNNYLKNFAYKINQGIVIYLFSAGITLLISFIVIVILTAKVAKSNPCDSLKYE